MVAPGRISIGSGVSTSKRSHGGVSRSRFLASAKNGNTSPGGRGSSTSLCSSNVCTPSQAPPAASNAPDAPDARLVR